MMSLKSVAQQQVMMSYNMKASLILILMRIPFWS